MVTSATALDMAKEIKGLLIVGTDRVCSNKKSRENKYSYSMPKPTGKVCIMQLICHGDR